MTVQLTNKSKRPFVVTLYHEHYCQNAGTCLCTPQSVQQKVRLPDGGFGTKVAEILVPHSLRLEPQQSLGELSDAILKVPQVAEAIQAQILACNMTAPVPSAVVNSASPETSEEDSDAEPRSSEGALNDSKGSKGSKATTRRQ